MKLITFCLVGITFFTFALSPDIYGEPAKELFTDVLSSADLNLEKERVQKNPAVIRSRYIEVKFDYLAGKDRSEEADIVVLNLFNNVSFIAVKDRLERRSADCYTWFGRIEREGYSHVILVVENGGMAGSIVVEGSIYQIRDLGDSIHAIYEIDQSAISYTCLPVIIPPVEIANASDMVPPTIEVDGDLIIDVMVVYTPDAASVLGNIASEIQLAIDETNQTYANSMINQRIRLVHTAQVMYEESSKSLNGDDLERLKIPDDGYMDEVHTLRDTYNADLVSLWVDYSYCCGVAYVFAFYVDDFESYAFSVVSVNCPPGEYVFAHELGHNMGAGHENCGGAYLYSCAYTYTPGRWRTLMTNHIGCDDCEEIPYFSNPEVSYEGVPTGVPEGEQYPADNARTLNNTGPIVASFRPKVATTSSTTSTAGPTTTTTIVTDTTTTTKEDGCFAEKIYGENSEETELLKNLRDKVLSKTQVGQEIIGLYYEWSPVIIKALDEDKEFKEEMKEMIDGILPLIKEE